MSVEHYIIKSFVKDKATYLKHKETVDAITVDGPIALILSTVEAYYTEFKEHQYIGREQLLAYLDLLYPALKDRDVYDTVLDRVYALEISDSITDKRVQQLKIKDIANKIAQQCIPAISNEKFDILPKIKELLDGTETLEEEVVEEDPYEDEDLTELLEENEGDGLSWRLQCLNDDLGPLPGGTLGHFFARPDAGKTSWIHSELSHFVAQGVKVMWFNNEEAKKKIKLRWHTAVTGVTKARMARDPSRWKQVYHDNGGNNMGIVDRAVLHLEEVEKFLMLHRPRIAVIDVGDKCVFNGSQAAGNNAGRLKAVYDKIREISKRCDKEWKLDIITTAQADAQAENSKWLYQTNLDEGKTGKPGAFDYIIGMGKLHSEEQTRYFYCCKNKLGNQSDKHVVTFHPNIARYE